MSETGAMPCALRQEEAAPAPRSGLHTVRLAAVIVALVCFAAFSPSLRNGLLPWDDEGNINQNPYLKPPTISGILYLWMHPYQRLYVPLFYTSFVPDLVLGGGRPWVFHLGNLLLHAIGAVVVLKFLLALRRASKQHGGSSAWPTAASACAGALVFGLHPIQTEVVAWATGRKDLVSGLFALIALWQYVEWREKRGKLRYSIAAGAFLLSLLGKPASVALPLAALALDFFALRFTVRRSLRALAPWFALSAAWAVMSMRVQGSAEQVAILPPAWTRPFIAADALLFYLGKVLVPLRFAPVYGRTPQIAVKTASIWFALPAALALLVAVFRRRSIWAAAAGVFIAFVLPVLGLVPFDYQRNSTVADRYVYVSMVGVAMAVSEALWRVWSAQPRWWRPAVTAGAAVILVALGMLSWRQSAVWRSASTLWKHAAILSPGSYVVQNSLGMVYQSEGLNAEAEAAYRESLRLMPSFAIAHNNLANLCGDLGRRDEAMKHYEKAIEADPDFVYARTNLGIACLDSGRFADAEKHSKHALKFAPAMPQALEVYVKALAAQNRLQDAIPELRAAVHADPSNSQVRELLGQLTASGM